MAKDLNKVQLTGHLGADPEMRYTPQGSAVTTFSVASNRTWNDKEGQRHEDTEWFRIVAWDKLAEICNQYLTKGTRVYMEGRLQTRKWTDKDGIDRYSTEVIAQDMIILSSRNERGQVADSAPDYDSEPAPAPARRPVNGSAPAPAARNGNGGAATTAAPARPAPARPAARNQPQPIDQDDDIPF
jgi:single-strand DNA-binding protein